MTKQWMTTQRMMRAVEADVAVAEAQRRRRHLPKAYRAAAADAGVDDAAEHCGDRIQALLEQQRRRRRRRLHRPWQLQQRGQKTAQSHQAAPGNTVRGSAKTTINGASLSLLFVRRCLPEHLRFLKSLSCGCWGHAGWAECRRAGGGRGRVELLLPMLTMMTLPMTMATLPAAGITPERGAWGRRRRKGPALQIFPTAAAAVDGGGEGGYCSINRAKRMNQCKSDTVAAAAMHTC